MELLLNISPMLKLAATLAVIVLLMRHKVPMGLALVAGSLSLLLCFPAPAARNIQSVAQGLSSQETLYLLAIVWGILLFSGALKETGQFDRIIQAFERFAGVSRSALVAFPALVGLLPMPGGALFSAPMVGAAVRNADLEPARAAIANYWFRHIWEYWFPIYPGVVVALALTAIPPMPYILAHMPMTLWALAAGYVVILRPIRLSSDAQRGINAKNARRFARELTPILIVVLTVLTLLPLTHRVVRLAPEWKVLLERSPVLVALVLAVAWLMARRGLRPAHLKALCLKKNMLEMGGLILGLMVFKSVLEGCGAVAALRDELHALGVPLIIVVCLLPFTCAVVLGIAVGFVGTSFPLLIALLADVPPDQRLPWFFLAFTMGYAGMMLSPVHICLVVTNQYFKSSILRLYAFLVPLALSSMAFALALFFLYRRIWSG